MILDDFATYLQSAGIAASPFALFKSKMPDQPDEAICLYEYGGASPHFSHSGMNYTNPSLQIVVRGKDYKQIRSKAESIFNLLANLSNFNVGESLCFRVEPVQSPFPLEPDNQARMRIASNYNVALRAQ